MKKIILTAIFITFITTSVISLNYCSSPVVPNRDVVFPDSLVSYVNHVQPFLQVKCAFCPCHCLSPQNGATIMTDYFSLFSTENTGLIVPYKPDQSLFIQIIEERIPHNPYFQTNYISDNQKKGLRQWILEGAKNN